MSEVIVAGKWDDHDVRQGRRAADAGGLGPAGPDAITEDTVVDIGTGAITDPAFLIGTTPAGDRPARVDPALFRTLSTADTSVGTIDAAAAEGTAAGEAEATYLLLYQPVIVSTFPIALTDSQVRRLPFPRPTAANIGEVLGVVDAGGGATAFAWVTGGGGLSEPVSFAQPVTLGPNSYLSLPDIGTNTDRTLVRAVDTNTGGVFRVGLDSTDSGGAFVAPDLVYTLYSFNGNADGRTDAAFPAFSGDLEFTYRTGVGLTWQGELHLVKYNVGTEADHVGVRADSWAIEQANLATFAPTHALQASTHAFTCFAPHSVTAVAADRVGGLARQHSLAWDFVRLFDSHLVIAADHPYTAITYSYDLPLAIQSPGYAVPLALNSCLTLDDGLTDVTSAVQVRAGALKAGGVARVIQESNAGGDNAHMQVWYCRDSGGDVNRSAKITGNGQLSLGIADESWGGMQQAVFEDTNDPQLFRVKHRNYYGVVAEVVQRRPATDAGTAITLGTADHAKQLETTSGSAVTATLSETAAVNTQLSVIQAGAGQVTFAAGAGGSLRNRQGHTKTAGQWAAVGVYVRANSGGSAAEWVLIGDTA